MLATLAITTVTWVAVTFATRPESDETLRRFFERVRPAGPGWRPFATSSSQHGEDAPMPVRLRDWAAGCILVYGSLFGVGSLLLRKVVQGAALLSIATAAAFVIARDLRAYRI
jgi:hypothetical protein